VTYEDLRKVAIRCANFHPDTPASLSDAVESMTRRFPGTPNALAVMMAEYIEKQKRLTHSASEMPSKE
jgi:hypothetical protein